MKILKKIAACVLAATIAAGSLTVGASAASAKMKLLTVSIDKIEGADEFMYVGDGYYALNNSVDPNEDPDFDQIIYVGEDELKSWRKTGKFSYKKVKTDVDMTDLQSNVGFSADGSYTQLVTCDNHWNVLKRHIVSHNEKNTKLTTAYTKGSDWAYTNPDGYTVEAKWNKAKTVYTITITAPDGTKKNKKLTYKGEGDARADICASENTGKYAAYVLWKTNEYVYDFFGDKHVSFDIEIYGVKKNGTLETIHSFGRGSGFGKEIFGLSDLKFESDHLSMGVFDEFVEAQLVYFPDSGRKFYFSSVENLFFRSPSIEGKVYGSRAVVYGSTVSGFATRGEYILADLSTAYGSNGDGGQITALSNAYWSMSTLDGKIYLVQNKKGKWGYINKNGKELAMFDEAGAFIGDYAPVVKNGKAYLIDRSMKRVSEKIDAYWVYTHGEGLYEIEKDDKIMLMTYKK